MFHARGKTREVVVSSKVTLGPFSTACKTATNEQGINDTLAAYTVNRGLLIVSWTFTTDGDGIDTTALATMK